MSGNPRVAFFDRIAEMWDGWEDLDALAGKLAAGIEELGVRPDETVLDVGCGTGNLTHALLARLSRAGRVVAIDISPRMIEVARAKVPDERVAWRVADARSLPLKGGSCDRVLCCSVWPHVEDREAVAGELRRVLRAEGHLHIWHLMARERVNEIHAAAGDAVRHDTLPPVAETAKLLADAGFEISAVLETTERYLVTAQKPAR